MQIFLSANECWNILNFRRGLVSALLAAGHRVDILAPEDRAAPELARMGCTIRPLRMQSNGTSPGHDLALLRQYRRIYAAAPRAVALHFTIKPVLYGTLASRGTQVTPVNTVTGLGTAFIRGGLLQRVAEGLYRVSQRTAGWVFAHNGDDLALLTSRGLVPADRASVVGGSGVDTARFHPVAVPQARGAHFLMISRVLRSKGAAEFLAAARIVRRLRPECRFTLLGGWPRTNPDALGAAEVAQAEGAVEMPGDVADVRPWIAAADCVVLPSWREGAPRALIEGAAMGRPLIATDVPGCRDIVIPGVNGWLCPHRDAEALARRMRAFAETDAAMRAGLGAASRAIVTARYDEREVVRTYLAAIRRLSAGAPPRADAG